MADHHTRAGRLQAPATTERGPEFWTRLERLCSTAGVGADQDALGTIRRAIAAMEAHERAKVPLDAGRLGEIVEL
jgi:hypothetical protein